MSLDNLTGRVGRSAPAGATPGGLVEATIATTPAGGEPVDVLIAGDAQQRTGPCVWTPLVIDGEMFTPARDDPCFVQKARKGGSVVVWWEPGDDRAGVAIDTTPTAASLAQPGDIKWTGRATAPTGWLECYGTAVSRTTYAALFAEIGTTHGAGDGSTTFNLPDMRGRVPVGAGAGAGLTARTVGQTGGTETHTLTIGEVPSSVLANTSGGALAASGVAWLAPNVPQGGGGAHQNMQPWLALLPIIKT